jgi:tetratricopeptide (TPR) repeat protein
MPPYEISVMLHAVEGYLFAGRQEDALAIARRALDLARDRSERGSEAQALRLLAELASRSEVLDVRQAEERYRKALTLADDLGMRPLVAHCHLGLGKLYRRTGKREEALECPDS